MLARIPGCEISRLLAGLGVPTAVLEVGENRQVHVLAHNPAFVELHGGAIAQAPPYELARLLPLSGAQPILSAHERAARHNRRIAIEHDQPTPEGTRRLRRLITPLFGETAEGWRHVVEHLHELPREGGLAPFLASEAGTAATPTAESALEPGTNETPAAQIGPPAARAAGEMAGMPGFRAELSLSRLSATLGQEGICDPLTPGAPAATITMSPLMAFAGPTPTAETGLRPTLNLAQALGPQLTDSPLSARSARATRLHEREAQLAQVLGELRDFKRALEAHCLVSIADTGGRITYANDRFCAISGYSREELIGNTHRILKSGIHPPSFYDEMWRTLRSGRIWHGEICNRARDGSLYWVDSTIVPFLNQRGRPTQYVSVRTDISYQKMTEQALTEARDAAEAANKAKTAFLAMVSHELRTPLNAILGFSQMMRAEMFGPLGDARYGDYAARIEESGSHLLSLICDILDTARLESGELALSREEIDLPALAARIAQTMAPEAERANVTLELALPDRPITVLADPTRLRQILINLIANAVKFTPAGGRIALEIAETETGGARLVVQDTGIGMDSQALSRVAQPFTQLRMDYSRAHEGMGMGLHIARRLIELHGGWLEIDSSAGQGTRVTILIPPAVASGLQDGLDLADGADSAAPTRRCSSNGD